MNSLPPSDNIPGSNPVSSSRNPARLGRVLLVIAGGFLLIAAFGILKRHSETRKLQEEAAATSIPTVAVTHPEKTATSISIALPSETQAYTQAPIYAQASGYLKKWNFDIGAHVKKGDTLAEIDTPALDQQLAQAQAGLKQAQAALWLSQATYARYEELLSNKVISSQDFDNKTGDYREKQAAVATDEANLRQTEALMAFKIVEAPFDGIVSARFTDIGALVNANSGAQLFTVTQVDPLRVYLNVPQTLASSIHSGTKADLTFDSFPGKKFPAEVTATAGAINPTTRTLLIQLILPNKEGELLPGSYATAHLYLESDSSHLLIPANTLLFRSEGPSVALVGEHGVVEIRSIKIARDLGDKLEIASGLKLTDQIILNPSDSIVAGDQVKIASPAIH